MRNFSMKRSLFSFFIVILILAGAFIPAAAEETSGKSRGSIRKIDLGVSRLTMEAGETYVFNITFTPADPAFPWLNWFVSDESVASIDPDHRSITAHSAGTVRIMAETFDRTAYAVCDVTVSGSG